MEALLRDIRFGLKLLLKEKAFSATVLTTLAVCIGANVAIFSVIHTVLLEPLPFEEPDQLVAVYNSYPGAGVERASNGSFDFFMRRERIDAFEEVMVAQGSGHTVGEAGSTEQLSSMRVTPSFFPLLGVDPVLGRTFTEDEMDLGNDQKVVLTWGYWQDAFGGSPDVIGQDLRLDGRPYTIVGVLPEDFIVPQRPDTRFFVPIAFTDEQRTIDSWHSNNFQMMARLRSGATVEQAQAQNDALNEALIDQWPLPNARQILKDARFSTVLVGAQDDMIGDIRPTLLMLWAGVGFVLLIGCVNITNLMLARSQVRLGELATKLALGARRARVARQMLTEATVMALVGGGLGVGVGLLGLRFLRTLGVDDLPRGTQVSVDATVLGFALALAVVAALLFAAIPIAHVMRSDLTAVFRSESRTGTANRRAVLLRSSLVTGQVGLAFVLLIGAGLMLMSFRAALAVDPGFEPRGVWTGMLSLPSARYPDADARRQFTDELLTEVGALPGVRSASLTTQLPFSGNNSSSVILPEGYVPQPGESLLSPYQTWVGPEYFAAMGIGLVEGRVFEPSDGPNQPQVIVIDEWLARRYWPESSPLGKRMAWGVVPDAEGGMPEESMYTVVGVVQAIKQNDLTVDAANHVGAYYFTYRQQPPGFVTLVARAVTRPESLTQPIRHAVSRLDSELPLFGVETMESRIHESLASRRASMTLLLVFAGVALFLAAIGIYGALAYSVTQRTRELGIRLAMGSAPEGIFRIVVGQGVRVTSAGLVLGAGASLLLVRLIQSMLFGVESTDPRVLGMVALLLGAVALAACVVPAYRATRVDPVCALTYN